LFHPWSIAKARIASGAVKRAKIRPEHVLPLMIFGDSIAPAMNRVFARYRTFLCEE
jgi:hypothetical protein